MIKYLITFTFSFSCANLMAQTTVNKSNVLGSILGGTQNTVNNNIHSKYADLPDILILDYNSQDYQSFKQKDNDTLKIPIIVFNSGLSKGLHLKLAAKYIAKLNPYISKEKYFVHKLKTGINDDQIGSGHFEKIDLYFSNDGTFITDTLYFLFDASYSSFSKVRQHNSWVFYYVPKSGIFTQYVLEHNPTLSKFIKRQSAL